MFPHKGNLLRLDNNDEVICQMKRSETTINSKKTISQKCLRHKRQKQFVCRNIIGCGCQGKLYCQLCVRASITKNTPQHDYQDVTEFIEILYPTQQITESRVIDTIQALIFSNQLFSSSEQQMRISQLTSDVWTAVKFNKQLRKQLENDKDSTEEQIRLKEIHADKINEVSALESPFQLPQIESSSINQGFYGKRIRIITFEGIDRQYPKFFKMKVEERGQLFVLNEVNRTFSILDLRLSIEINSESLLNLTLPQGIQLPRKSKIVPLAHQLFCIHSIGSKQLFIVSASRGTIHLSKKHLFFDAVLGISHICNKKHILLIQFAREISVYKYSKNGEINKIRAIKSNFFSLCKPKCIKGETSVEAFFFTGFSIIRIFLHTGQTTHTIINKQFQKVIDNLQNVNGEEEIVIQIARYSIGELRRSVIQKVKRLSDKLILIVYAGYIELRALTQQFELLETFQMACVSVEIIPQQNIGLLLIAAQSHSVVISLDLQTLQTTQLFTSNEIYAKIIYSNHNTYLIKHSYFEVSDSNSNFHKLVLHLYR